jgi:hypothetical protein
MPNRVAFGKVDTMLHKPKPGSLSSCFWNLRIHTSIKLSNMCDLTASKISNHPEPYILFGAAQYPKTLFLSCLHDKDNRFHKTSNLLLTCSLGPSVYSSL